MSPIRQLPRTSFLTLYARRVPDLAVWAGGMTFFLGWPHLWAAVSNRAYDVPDINMAYI